jgi:hypothetical protein
MSLIHKTAHVSVIAAAAAMHEKKKDNNGKKRGWEPWSAKEMHSFFEALEKHGKDFEQIQAAVGTKHYQQVCFKHSDVYTTFF